MVAAVVNGAVIIVFPHLFALRPMKLQMYIAEFELQQAIW